jgi:hypothetical protein
MGVWAMRLVLGLLAAVAVVSVLVSLTVGIAGVLEFWRDQRHHN